MNTEPFSALLFNLKSPTFTALRRLLLSLDQNKQLSPLVSQSITHIHQHSHLQPLPFCQEIISQLPFLICAKNELLILCNKAERNLTNEKIEANIAHLGHCFKKRDAPFSAALVENQLLKLLSLHLGSQLIYLRHNAYTLLLVQLSGNVVTRRLKAASLKLYLAQLISKKRLLLIAHECIHAFYSGVKVPVQVTLQLTATPCSPSLKKVDGGLDKLAFITLCSKALTLYLPPLTDYLAHHFCKNHDLKPLILTLRRQAEKPTLPAFVRRMIDFLAPKIINEQYMPLMLRQLTASLSQSAITASLSTLLHAVNSDDLLLGQTAMMGLLFTKFLKQPYPLTIAEVARLEFSAFQLSQTIKHQLQTQRQNPAALSQRLFPNNALLAYAGRCYCRYLLKASPLDRPLSTMLDTLRITLDEELRDVHQRFFSFNRHYHAALKQGEWTAAQRAKLIPQLTALIDAIYFKQHAIGERIASLTQSANSQTTSQAAFKRQIKHYQGLLALVTRRNALVYALKHQSLVKLQQRVTKLSQTLTSVMHQIIELELTLASPQTLLSFWDKVWCIWQALVIEGTSIGEQRFRLQRQRKNTLTEQLATTQQHYLQLTKEHAALTHLSNMPARFFQAVTKAKPAMTQKACFKPSPASPFEARKMPLI